MKDFFEGNCDIAHDLLPLYADNAVCTKTFKMLNLHLLKCTHCREFLRETKEYKKQTEQKSYPNPNPDYAKLRRRLRNRRAILSSAISAVLVTSIAANVITLLVSTER